MNPIIHDPDIAHLVHYLLEWLAITTGVWIYRKRQLHKGVVSVTNGPAFSLIIGCLLGAGIGNKAVFWLENPQAWTQAKNIFDLLLQGQSIVGGLLGGWIGVELAKKITHWTGPRTGDDFVPAILGGILVGRVGCFVAGLHDGTYGLPTDLPWGIDLGDGQPRHPAPLYEWLIALLALSSWPVWSRKLAATPGLAFRYFMLAYMIWRLWADGLKPVPYPYWLGLSGIQWICLISAIAIATHLLKDRKGTTP